MSYSRLRQSCSVKYWDRVRASELADLKGVPNKCNNCGTTENLTIDHKLPRSTHPKAAGLLANYQLLCDPCNQAKANKYLSGKNDIIN